MSETKGHDDLCPTGQNEDSNCWFCEHNAKVRADEREQVALDTAAGIVDPGLRAVIVDEALADLWAKVKALPVVVVDLDPDPHGRPIERRAVLLSDVLALLEEKP